MAVDSPVEEILAMLRGKISDDDLAAVEAKLAAVMGGEAKPAAADPAVAAADADDPTKKKEDDPLAKDTPPPFTGKPDDPVPKKAMDAAITAAVEGVRKQAKVAQDAAISDAVTKARTETIAALRAVSEAEEAVRPYVGKLAVACDSAEGVYKTALEVLGVKVEGIHPSAFKAVLEAQPRPDGSGPRLVHDAAPSKDFSERFPNANRLRSA